MVGSVVSVRVVLLGVETRGMADRFEPGQGFICWSWPRPERLSGCRNPPDAQPLIRTTSADDLIGRGGFRCAYRVGSEMAGTAGPGADRRGRRAAGPGCVLERVGRRGNGA